MTSGAYLVAINALHQVFMVIFEAMLGVAVIVAGIAWVRSFIGRG